MKEVMGEERLTCQQVWDRVSHGEWLPYRVARGKTWQWHFQRTGSTEPHSPEIVR
jgi:hypothetical protein